MASLTLAAYVVLFALGTGGLACLALLRVRRRVTLPYLLVDACYGLGLLVSMAYFYASRVVSRSVPIPLPDAAFHAAASLLQFALYAAAALIAAGTPRPESRLFGAVRVAAVAAGFAACAASLLDFAASVLPPSIDRALRVGQYLRIADPVIVLAAIALLGLFLLRPRAERSPLSILDRWWGASLLAFVPLTLAEWFVFSGDAAREPLFHVDFLLFVAMSLGSIAALHAEMAGGAGAPTAFDVPARRLEELGFTPREAEIVPLVFSGLGNKQIADKLGISHATVRTHLYRMFQKAGARSRMEFLNKLCRGGGLPK